jgi:PAS domain S-box-containing protein
LLSAVNRTAEILLKADETDFEASLMEGMAIIADCVSIDRIYIWKAEKVKGASSYYLDYKYVSSSLGQGGEPVPLGTRFKGDTGFEKADSRRNCINGPVSGLPEEWRSLSEHDVKSILIIPLFLHDNFWGQISFDDCREERVFSEIEVSLLRSASLMMANARNRHEEAALIRDAEQRTRLMLDTMPMCCQVWSKNMTILDCNEAAVKLYGLRDKREFTEKFSELSPEYQPDGRRSEEMIPMLLKKAQDGQYCVFEWMHQMLDGTPMPSEVTLTQVKYGNEQLIIGYTRDLREHKMMMQKIESLLFETQAANHAKSELMARMSHEMLTPMNAIMGLTQVAQMSDLADSLKGYLDEIDNASKHLLRLINDVLDMSNMTFDIFKLDSLAFSFVSVFDDALKIVSRFMNAKQQVFTFDIDRSIPPLLIGDKKRLGQVIVKILENAAKFTPEHGEIRFTACAVETADNMVTLRIEVTDNGLGIAEERQKNLFNVFEQIDGGNTRKQGGIGLGLALAKRIIETMGGEIWVESELGKGSKFTFTCKVQQQSAVYELKSA